MDQGTACTSRDVGFYRRPNGNWKPKYLGRKVGEVAAATGLTVRNLRHYEEIGLPAPLVVGPGAPAVLGGGR
jgi:hypothetical protein